MTECYCIAQTGKPLKVRGSEEELRPNYVGNPAIHQ